MSDILDVGIKVSTIALAILTFIILIVAITNYKKFVENVNLFSEGVKLQAASLSNQSKIIDLQAKNLWLTHKPVVFIEDTIPPQHEVDKMDPLKHRFIVTNSGKLPARNVNITVSYNFLDEKNNKMIDSTITGLAIDDATVFPNTKLSFWIPRVVRTDNKIVKAEATFTIEYMDDEKTRGIKDNLKFIFSEGTLYRWLYVGPNVDFFAEERKAIK